MLHPPFRHAALVAATVMSLGLTIGANAQTTTDQGTPGGAATPPAAGSTKNPAKSGSMAGTLDRADKKFLEKAATGGMMEVQLGEMAQQKAASEQVKEFGKRMAEDHGKANDELKQIASAKGAALPASVDKSAQKDLQKFEKLSGADFDRQYMKHMVDDHKKDVSDFQKQAKSAKDPEVKDFAAKTLPTLQEHMKMAQSTYDAVKNTKSSSATKSSTSRSPSPSSDAPSGTGSTPMPGTPPTSTQTK